MNKHKHFCIEMIPGAIQKQIQHSYTTVSVLKNDTDGTLSPPEQYWHHWVVVNVRKNNLNSGTIIQPFNVNWNVQPNSKYFTFK